MDTMINAATSSVATQLGFTFSDIVTWMGDTLLKPLIGSGLGVLYSLRWWIIGLVVLSAIIYFAFRGFGFFRH